MIRELFRVKARIARNKIFSYRFHSRFKGLVIGLFLLAYLFGGYFLLHRGFAFVQGFVFVGDILLDKVIELFFFALFVMLVISQALFAYGSYFRSKELSFLRTIPVPPASLFAWEFWETSLLSSWTFLFLSVPMLVAYAQVRGIFFSFVGLFLLLFLPLILIAGALGTLLAFAFVRIWRSRRGWFWMALAGLAAMGLIAAAVFLGRRMQPELQPTMNQILDKMLRHTQFIQWPFWPSQWVSRAMLGFLKGEFLRAVGYLWFLWLTAAFLVQGILLWGGELLDSSLEWERRRRTRAARAPLRLKFLNLPARLLLGRAAAAVFLKDIKNFLRDPAQWSHFAIFFGLLGLYFLNLRNLRYDVLGQYWKNLITFLNMTTVGLVAGTLATRFFFPLPSLEIRHRWIWRAEGAGKILRAKFVVGFLFLLGVTEGLMVLSCNMLRVEGWMLELCLAADFFICLTMISLSLGLGAMFPVPKEDVSAKIVSGFGGTLCLVMTLAYLAVVVLAIALPLQWFLVQRAISGPVFVRWMTASGAMVVLLSLGLSAGSLWMGARAMRTSEF